MIEGVMISRYNIPNVITVSEEKDVWELFDNKKNFEEKDIATGKIYIGNNIFRIIMPAENCKDMGYMYVSKNLETDASHTANLIVSGNIFIIVRNSMYTLPTSNTVNAGYVLEKINILNSTVVCSYSDKCSEINFDAQYIIQTAGIKLNMYGHTPLILGPAFRWEDDDND